MIKPTWHDIEFILIRSVVVWRVDDVLDKSDIVATWKGFAAENFPKVREYSVVFEDFVNVEEVSHLLLDIWNVSDEKLGIGCDGKQKIIGKSTVF
jgi:hypothetical protein